MAFQTSVSQRGGRKLNTILLKEVREVVAEIMGRHP